MTISDEGSDIAGSNNEVGGEHKFQSSEKVGN
jgi:hypothetical protein